MRDYQTELIDRVSFIRSVLEDSHAEGIVFGNSGGKDSALVGILCKKACENTLGLIMPCSTQRNYQEDATDAHVVAEQYGIETRTVDLTPLKALCKETLQNSVVLTSNASMNLAPRLRMMTLYAVAASENRLVAGTGNRSEGYVGYFTKWGDGAFDFNPIADLTVAEIYAFLAYLHAPQNILQKAPSAGLFEGQTDEREMGFSYQKLDEYLMHGNASVQDKARIEHLHCISAHKRRTPYVYDTSGVDHS